MSFGWICPNCRGCYSPTTPQCYNCTGRYSAGSSSTNTSFDVQHYLSHATAQGPKGPEVTNMFTVLPDGQLVKREIR